ISALSSVYQAASTVLTALAGIGAAVAGDIIYATGANTWARLTKGTALQVLQMNAGATAPQWGSLPFAKSFVSAGQTITSGGALTIAHGLGGVPKSITATLICTTADQGYSVGDNLAYALGLVTAGGFNQGVAVVGDATNLVCRFGNNSNSIASLHKTTGV